MVKPKATRCAKIPLPLRSHRVSLGSLCGAGTRPTSRDCMAVPSRPTLPAARARLPGLRSRRRPRLRERLLPGTPPAMRRFVHSALWGLGESASVLESPEGRRRLDSSGPTVCLLPNSCVSLCLPGLTGLMSQIACGNYIYNLFHPNHRFGILNQECETSVLNSFPEILDFPGCPLSPATSSSVLLRE